MTDLMTNYQKTLQLTQHIHELAVDNQWERVDEIEKERKTIIEKMDTQQLLKLTNDEKKKIELILIEICSLNKEILTLSNNEYDEKKSLVIGLKKSQKMNQQYQPL